MILENSDFASIIPTHFAENGQVILCVGNWKGTKTLNVVQQLKKLLNDPYPIVMNLSKIQQIDTIGIGLIIWLVRHRKGKVHLEGASSYIQEMMSVIPRDLMKPMDKQSKTQDKVPLLETIFAPVGKIIVEKILDFIFAIYIFGSTVSNSYKISFHHYKRGIPLSSIINHIDLMGVRGIPVIFLMSFLTGAIIVQQGAFQLRNFGAEIFVIDLISTLQLREIGVLLTAIMVAGRSGSSITAEIGSMKMREEIDALKVMGLGPIRLLISPRLVALAISLPLLTIIAHFSAILGASIVVELYSGITFSIFFSRLHAIVTTSSIIVGLIKAPFMALAIGIIATSEGLKVEGSAESLGKRVTIAVVKSISIVIIIDALFAFFYSTIGV
ncbi:ABC-type transport system [Liberibacter crescens BT-1]|uniref:ABC-type transport system n=1 Tax=Liberibacter crescens (strain BT-1) TaxID=1215343 RepID=L0EWR2_LIBCB|nr:ABC transporter permease [Liberibacter crescens]AGA64821.1 ABC-type transport system [Liberibacter crescens BT-1]AMC12877.1 toluene ABC transporter permease [Liberibacter crescens]